MTTVERVRVGDVLRLARRAVVIDPNSDHTLIGVYSFGKGIFHRDPKPGAELGDYRFFRIAPGDLVLSNIQAWEGAIALATDHDAGTIGTHRFLSYVPIADQIDTNWARWFFLSEPGMQLIRRAAPGTAVRNRTLAVKRFEELVIPLPTIEEQKLVVETLDGFRRQARRMSAVRQRVEVAIGSAVDSGVRALVDRGRSSGWDLVPLGQLAEVNPARAKLRLDEPVAFVPMAAVSAQSGAVDGAEAREAGAVNGGYRQFRRGDILFARITPCMQNGKSAIFEGPSEYGYGSSEFHVLRPFDEGHAVWLHRFLRSRELRESAVERMTGTAGQQRVPASFLEKVIVPLPPRPELLERAAAMDRLTAFGQRLYRLEQTGTKLGDAIEPALLNRAFRHLA